MIKLNLGSHGSNMDGYINVDLFDDSADLKADVTNLPFEDNSVDEIYAAHILEHMRMTNEYEPHLCNAINPKTVHEVLNEWKRVLKPGGRLEIRVPDFERIIWLYYNFPAWAQGAGPGGLFPNAFFWLCSVGQHQTILDQRTMQTLLQQIGFTTINFISTPIQAIIDRASLEMRVEVLK